MPYIIDGHNLIGKIPSLSLAAVDDEIQLIEMLQEFCQRLGKKVEVFFDNAPPGQLRAQVFGPVVARFIKETSTADEAIHKRLIQLGRESRNWTIVSSDHKVQASARAAKARVLTSEAFVKILGDTLKVDQAPFLEEKKPTPSPQEIEDWLKLFDAESNEE